MITVSCTNCGSGLRVRDDSVGKKVKCPTCGSVTAVTSDSADSASAAGQGDAGIQRQWTCVVGGNEYGPMPESQIRQWIGEGRLQAEDVLWSDGMPGWVSAGSISEFANMFSAPAAAVAPASAAVYAPPAGNEIPTPVQVERPTVVKVNRPTIVHVKKNNSPYIIGGCIAGAIVLLIIIIIVVAASGESGPVSVENYNKITKGMSFEEVEQILGPGKLVSSGGGGTIFDSHPEFYAWGDGEFIGSARKRRLRGTGIKIGFMSGKVVSKKQAGL